MNEDVADHEWAPLGFTDLELTPGPRPATGDDTTNFSAHALWAEAERSGDTIREGQ